MGNCIFSKLLVNSSYSCKNFLSCDLNYNFQRYFVRMNFFVDSQCPLCPHIAQHNVEQLANHLSISHLMTNSASILARIMMTNQMGQQEVVEVLRDVTNLTNKLAESVKVLYSKKLEVKKLKQKIANLEDTELSEAFKKNIVESDASTENLVSKKIDETKCKDEITNSDENKPSKNIAIEDVDDSKNACLLAIVNDKLNLLKDENLKKDKEIVRWKIGVLEQEAKVKSLLVDKKKLKSSRKELMKEIEVLLKEKKCEKKNKESFEFEEYFEKYKKVSRENIEEKDKMIAYLEKELVSIKADAKRMVDEREVCAALKLADEIAVSNMKTKMRRYREITCLMKDSLAGLTGMHANTSEKLVEAVKNTAHTSQVVVGEVKKQFKGLDEEMGHVSKDVVELVHFKENDVSNVKKEQSLLALKEMYDRINTQKNAKLVAQDLSKQFGKNYFEKDAGRTSAPEDDSGRRSGSSSRSNKRRKFTD